MISGQVGKYFLQIDHSSNFTQARVIDTVTGEGIEGNFVDDNFIYADKLAEVKANIPVEPVEPVEPIAQ